MAIKSILTVLTGSPGDEATLGCALQVAQNFGGHISAICASATDRSIGELGFLPEEGGSAVMEELAARERERAARARAIFDGFVSREALFYSDTPENRDDVSVSWESVEGSPDGIVEHRGGAYDLVVVGSPVSAPGDLGGGTALLNQRIFEAAAFSTGRPVLLAPGERTRSLGRTVLIGWNRSAQAARAFHAGKALLLGQAKRVRILSVTTGAKDGPPAERIAENLAWHGIDCDVRELSPDNRSVGTVLLAEASAIGADLLIAGAYTHSRLRQLLLGGVTQSLIAESRIPLFVAH